MHLVFQEIYVVRSNKNVEMWHTKRERRMFLYFRSVFSCNNEKDREVHFREGTL